MAPNRKRHAITAEVGRWKLLGELLEARRIESGYRFRPAFATERLPRTPDGNLNLRLPADIENNQRPGSWPPGTLRMLAQAYEVTYASVFAVLRGEADKLSPEHALPPGPAAPISDSRRTPPATDEDKIMMVIPLHGGTGGPAQLPARFSVELGDGHVTLAGDTPMTGAQAHVIIAALRKAFGEPPGHPGQDG